MTPLTIHLPADEALDLDTLSALTRQAPEHIAQTAIREYINTHPLQTMQAQSASSDEDIETQQNRRRMAKARLTKEGLGPVTLILDGVPVSDGLAYQKKLRAEW